MYNYKLLPEGLRGGVKRYVERGRGPGNFLTAVISNDLTEAFARADDTNRYKMHEIVSFFYNEVPGGCKGSKAKMEEWEKVGGLKGHINITPGTQILYVPHHAFNERNHPDTEMGFVYGDQTRTKETGNLFCRYFREDSHELRTLANGESTPIENLFFHDHRSQEIIDVAINEIESQSW